MKVERRVLVILVVLGVLAVPAAVLRVLCVGRACDEETATARRVPFCSLPEAVRAGIAAGYREGRSPDILGVTRRDLEIYSPGVDPGGSPWPSLGRPETNVPVIFLGHGVAQGKELPSDFELDDIAPTLAEIIDFEVPHPEVRSGRAAASIATGEKPRLVGVVVLRRVRDVVTDPVLAALAREGSATTTAAPGSLPLDTAALITTIGTGGTPSEHGITGSFVKNEMGKASQAWYARELGEAPLTELRRTAPRSVIATLADDLDEELRQEPKVGLVADTIAARGLVGGNWYVDNDRDDYRFVRSRNVTKETRALLASGYGEDDVVDIVGVSLRVNNLDGSTWALELLDAMQKASGNRAAMVVIALPRLDGLGSEIVLRAIGSEVDGTVITEELAEIDRLLVDATTAGGIFLGQKAFARAGTSRDEIVRELRSTKTKGEPVFADVFPDLAVSFARFC